MAKPIHCYYRLMTPDWLKDSKNNKATSVGLVSGRTSLQVPQNLTFTQDDILLRIPLLTPGQIKSSLIPTDDEPPDHDSDPPEDLIDLTIHINVGMRFNVVEKAEPKSPEDCCRISFMIAEYDCPADSDPHAIGFQIRDPSEFNEWGPYRGIEARVTRDAGAPLNNRPVSYIPDDRGDLGALEYLNPSSDEELEKAAIRDAEREALGQAKDKTPEPPRLERKDIPERFEITLKPNAWWGRCASSVEGGHSVSVAPYFGSVDVSEGLYLDVYGRKPGKNFYEIKYIEISIYR